MQQSGLGDFFKDGFFEAQVDEPAMARARVRTFDGSHGSERDRGAKGGARSKEGPRRRRGRGAGGARSKRLRCAAGRGGGGRLH